MKSRLSASIFFVVLSILGNAQNIPGIKLGYGHYGSDDVVRFIYTNLAETNYRRHVDVHNYTFPADIKLRISRTVRLGVRYAFGKYTAKDSKRAFLPSKNYTHTIALQCDLYLNPDMKIKAYFSPGIGLTFLKAKHLNPFYVGFETPYNIATSWRSNSLNLDLGAVYEIPKSRFSVEGVLGIRMAILNLKKMSFGNSTVNVNKFDSRIFSLGGIFEIGICYMFTPRNTEEPKGKR